MIPITLSLLTLAALGAAQNTTVSLLLPGFDPQSLVGSVVGVDAKATTYVVDCASGDSAAATTGGMSKKKRQDAAMTTAMASASPSDNPFDDTDGCGLISPVTITQGPSTFAMTLSIPEAGFDAVSCVLDGTTKAACAVSTSLASGYGYGTDSSDDPITGTTTLTGSDLPTRLPVVITAGAEKLSASAGTMTGTSTMTGTMTTGTAKADGNGGTTSKTSGTAAPASSTGGAVLGFEPVVGMGVAGAVAVGLGAILL